MRRNYSRILFNFVIRTCGISIVTYSRDVLFRSHVVHVVIVLSPYFVKLSTLDDITDLALTRELDSVFFFIGPIIDADAVRFRNVPRNTATQRTAPQRIRCE